MAIKAQKIDIIHIWQEYRLNMQALTAGAENVAPRRNHTNLTGGKLVIAVSHGLLVQRQQIATHKPGN